MRLKELGLKRIFGVAGNYAAPFLDTILEDKSDKRLQITGISNELCAGYAADGYARILGEKGLGAVAVTYGVGAFSLLNAVAGSYVEQVPIIVINGAPTNKQFTTQKSVGLLYSHMTPDTHSNIDVYRKVTAATARITNASEAPLQIDSVLAACITYRQPVYIEVLEDVWRAQCQTPPERRPISREFLTKSKLNTEDAVNATIELIQTYKKTDKAKPMFWAGAEIQRFGLQQIFTDLLQISGFEYTTSVIGKSVISEDHKLFSSVGLPRNASCVIGLGSWTTSKDIGSKSILGDRDKIFVSQGNAFVGGTFFANVPLGEYMELLISKLEQRPQPKLFKDTYWSRPTYPDVSIPLSPLAEDKLDYERFFRILNEGWIKGSSDTIVVVDASFPLIAAQRGLHIKAPNGFIAQASWLSIGYAAPAAIGVKCAMDDNDVKNKRVIVIAGDGAFQETCQAVSSYTYLRQNTVVFVLANGIYGIEQKIVNPNPFRDQPQSYSSREIYEYNKLCPWNYEKLTDVFGGGNGYVIDTPNQLEEVISTLKESENTDKNSIIHVKIPEKSIPPTLIPSLEEPGEDEKDHPHWPPKDIF